MTNFGKAYLAFAVADGAGHDVRAAYYDNGSWALEAAAAQRRAPPTTPGPAPGRRRSRPPATAWRSSPGAKAATCTRARSGARRRASSTSRPTPRRCPDAARCRRASPTSSAGGDSSYADVAFQETVLRAAASQQTRVLVNRLRASQYDGATAGDGLSTPGTDSAGEPEVAMTEYGQGFVTSAGESSNDVLAMELGNNGAYGPILQINSAGGDRAAVSRFPGSRACSRRSSPGSRRPARPGRRRSASATSRAPRRSDPSTVVSSPSQGATDAARGLAADGDGAGDAAIAWVQGDRRSTQIVVDQLLPAARCGHAGQVSLYSRTAQPVLSWSPSSARWGPITYTVSVDGAAGRADRAAARSESRPARRRPHSWRVTATNPAGLTGISKTARVFVDTVAPRAHGDRIGARAGAARTRWSRLSYRDPAPALRGRDADDQVGRRDASRTSSPARTGSPTSIAGRGATRSRSPSPTAPATRRRWSGSIRIKKAAPAKKPSSGRKRG